jgi:hypothetical protein
MGRIKTTLIKRTGKKLIADNPDNFSTDFTENKKKLDEKVVELNAHKLGFDKWLFVEKQPSNHQLCSIEIAKKDAKESNFEKKIIPEVIKILDTFKISRDTFNVYGFTSKYNKYLYLLSIFDTLGVNVIDGINVSEYVNSVIKLYYYSGKKLYKPDDFKLKDVSVSISVGGSNGKVESPKRNILIKVLNPKTIDYSNLKLKRRTNKRRLGKVYKNSRRRHSKHKARSKRNE